MTKLSELIQLSKAFSAEVNVARDFHYLLADQNEKIDGYLPNASSRKIFKEVLETLPTNTDRKAHLITASYGTGKSYLLLMLGHLLGNNCSNILDEFRQKITGKDDFYKDKLGQTLTNYIGSGDPYLIVIPNYADTDFNHSLLQGLNEALRHQNVDYIPATNYRRAAEVLKRWKGDGSANYTHFADRLSNMTPDSFMQLLNDTDTSAYQTFKQYFKDVIGVDFSENHAEDAYGVYAETAKAISNLGYRGIVILYDEFGTMLSNLINSPEGKGLAVQEFLEKVKRTGTGSNILFLAASHQDPTTLREDKQRDVTKVVGRFVRHQLDVTESEAEEILGTVFLHPDPDGFAALVNPNYILDATSRVIKHNLYLEKGDAWITDKILKNLYPLHPLTAYMLPRLSSEFAQNTRSMFNFLSPVEKKEGALALFLETTDTHTAEGWLQLFTPDRLLEFFEKNLADAKSEQVVNLTDSYRTAIHKLTDAPEIEQLYRALLLLTVVGGRLQPKKDLLFWALDWPFGKRKDFDNLLNDLVVNESLEYNPITEVYEFPMSGSKSVSKIIQEEKQKLAGLSLSECAAIWDQLEPRPLIEPADQQDKYGANRYFKAVGALKIMDLTGPIDNLNKFYQGATDNYLGNGLLFYLLAPTQADYKPLVNVLQQATLTQPYTFYAILKDGIAFDLVQDRTLDYVALKETLNRAEVKANFNQQHGVREQLRAAEARLQQAIKDLYQPSQWFWYYSAETIPREFKSQTSFLNWFNEKVEELFTASSVPVVRESVLWFKEAEKPSRSKALAMLWDADKDGLHLSSSATTKPPQNRILENFLRNLKLSKDGKTVSGITYGDLKNPEPNTAAAAIFRYFDKALKTGGSPIDPTSMLAGLLQEPFGLSRPLILFMLTAYARANRDELVVSDPKRNQPRPLSAELFEQLIRKPQEFRIRRIDMPGPLKRYLDRLRTLFEHQTATSFGEIGQQMTGLTKFLSPLQRTLIKQEKSPEVAAFYDSLDAFTEKMATSGAAQDADAREFLLEILPDNLLGLTRAEFEDDANTNIEKLITLLRNYKDFPGQKERSFRLETLTLMAQAVFSGTLVNKEDIKKITEAWYAKLPPATRKHDVFFEQPKVNEWLSIIRNGTFKRDLFEVYLSDLTINPDKDWTGNLMQCQSRYIDEFKEYKKVVEEYTQSPLPIYKYIALTAFGVPNADCSTETAFVTIFSNWYNGLSKQIQQYLFDDLGVRILLENANSSLSAKQRFLEVIPTRWKDTQQLPTYIPTKWEEWSDTQIRAVAEEYERCCQIISNWKPAVTEAEYFTQIGQAFGLDNITNATVLQEALTEQWLPILPKRTRTAPWASMRSIDAQFMANLQEGDFYVFTTEILPQHFGLPGLQKMDNDTLLAFVPKVEAIKAMIEAYRRPLEEVIGELTKKQYDTVADYQNNLYATIRATEAFVNSAEKDDTLPLAPLPRLLLSEVRLNQPFNNVVSVLAEQLNLPTDHHEWSPTEQLQFIRSTNDNLKTLQKWRFPQDRKMADAKAELSKTIWQTRQDYGLSVGQMRKIVNDIFEQPVNGHS